MKIQKLSELKSLAFVIVLATGVCLDAKETSSNSFTFPSTGITVKDQAVLLAIDDFSLPLKKDLCYYLSKPKIRKDPVLLPSRNDLNAPDFLRTQFYGTVLFDKGKFRMWYYACSVKGDWKIGEPFTGVKQGPVCYAESEDGIHWIKPNLGQVLFKGNKNNNGIALPSEITQAATLIKDEDEPDPARRYKMVYCELCPKKFFTMRTATSSDGIHWTAGAEMPVDRFMEHCSFYKYNSFYFVNAQTYDRSEGGDWQGRQGYTRISADFDNWLTEVGESFLLPEPAKGRGITKEYDQVHLGVGAMSLGNVLVGVYGLWHHRTGYRGTSCDLGLVVSNDGMHFREPVKGHVFISQHDSPVTPVEGKDYPTILCQGNGILNVGDETRIYHSRWRNAPYSLDYYAEVGMATLPRDRWAAIGLIPPLEGHSFTAEGASIGTVWSAAVVLPAGGCKIFLNADDADCMSVEISDERFNLIPEYCGANSGVVKVKGGLDCPVTWPKGKLKALRDKTIRLRITLKKKVSSSEPRLFAVYLKAGN
ncbi:MAG: hypothetical protein JXB29_05380 [Sedimentisphaerales bacterium]|nr:hypothetical protein [Sedimentisphaerales bacterium]